MISWTETRRQDPATPRWEVAWFRNLFVSFGSLGLVETSPDAKAWTVRSSGTNHNLYASASNGQCIVAVGDDGVIVRSLDGWIWHVVRQPGGSSLTCVIWTGTSFLAAGADGLMVESVDGVTWATVNSGTTAEIDALAVTPRGIVAAASSGNVGLATGGKFAWRKLGGVITKEDGSKTLPNWKGLSCHGDIVVIGGGASWVNEIWRSRDGGATWSLAVRTSGKESGIGLPATIIWAGDRFLASGNGDVALDGVGQTYLGESKDGMTWARNHAPARIGSAAPEYSASRGMCWDGDKTVISVGDRATVFVGTLDTVEPPPTGREKWSMTVPGGQPVRINFPAGVQVSKVSDIKWQAGDTVYNVPAGTAMERMEG